MDDGDAGCEPECPYLGRGGHPGADLLLEVVEVVAEFFEPGVDATGVGFGDGRATGVSELSTNANRHTASGLDSGSFHLAVAASAVAVSITDDGGAGIARPYARNEAELLNK